MFTKNHKASWVFLSVVVVLLLSVGCSGNTVSPLDSGKADIEFNVSDTHYGLKAISAPGPEIATEIEKDIPDTLDWLTYLLKHNNVESGENIIDVTKYLEKSSNAYVDHDDVYLNHMDMVSSVDEISYITYGFKSIPEDEKLTGVKIWGDGTFGTSSSSGLYIGVGNYDNDAYKWYGPFTDPGDWAVNFNSVDSANENQRAYLTLVLTGGDRADIRDMAVYVGDGLVALPDDMFVIEEIGPIVDPSPVTEPIPGPIPDPGPGPHPGF